MEPATGQVEWGPVGTDPPCSPLHHLRKNPKGRHAFRGDPIATSCAALGRNGFPVLGQPADAIAWGPALPLLLRLIPFPPQTPPAQVSEEAGGDFSVHKSVWFLERAHISQPFSLPQTTPPGEADGDSVSNADGRVGAPQNRTPGGAGLGSVDSCRSRALRQEGQNDTQVAGRQDGRQEPEPRTRAAPSRLKRRPGLTCGRAEHSPPGDGRPEKWGRGPAGPGTEGTVPP